MSRAVCIIPARWGSTRFPGKPIVPITGSTGRSVPLIIRTLNVAKQAECFDSIHIATDSHRIADEVRDWGYGDLVVMTGDRRNGTERCAEAFDKIEGPSSRNDIVVNLQGDAVLTPPAWLDTLVDYMRRRPTAPVATLVYRRNAFDPPSPGDVQAIVEARRDRALYFSRGALPASPRGRLQHFGIYAYRGWALRNYLITYPSEREEAESLEQLRFLESGINIACIHPKLPGGVFPEREVNYPDDVQAVEEVLRKWNIQ